MSGPASAAASPLRALVGPGALVATAVIAANGLNAAFQFALARILDPGQYSLLAALVVVTLIAQVPPLAFQAGVARDVAVALADGRRADAGSILRGTLRGLLLWSGVLVVAAGVAYPILAAISAGAPAPTAATAATCAATLAVPAVWGGLQGAHRFGSLSLAHLCFAGTRLVAAIAIGLAGGDASEVMGGVAAATVVTLAVTALPLRELLAAARSAARRASRLATLPNAAAAVGLTILTALSGVDLLVAKLAFDGRTAGAYAAASVGARVLLLLPTGVTTVLLPRVATLRDPVRERRHLLGGLAAVAAGSAVVTAVLWAAGGDVVDLAFGTKYHRAGDWLGPLALAMSMYALATVYLFHFLALNRPRYAGVLVALLAAQIAAFAAFHARPGELVGVQLAISGLTLASAELWYLARHAPRTAGSRR